MPVSPFTAEIHKVLPQAPPPLAERRYYRYHPPITRPQERIISWSEEQINTLQEDNRKLRQEIINQKKMDSDRDHIIAMLRQQNYQSTEELRRQNEALIQHTNMAVAIQNPKHLPLHRLAPSPSGSSDCGIIDDIIEIYNMI